MLEAESIYRKAIAHYGDSAQCIVAIEELSELQKEICKDLRGIGDVNHIAEEIADAQIMIEQLILIFNCKEEVEAWRDKKLIRLEGRLYGI